jgi:hypothetical protein
MAHPSRSTSQLLGGSLLGMERPPDRPGRRTFLVRFEQGPRHATVATVVGFESGQPPDFIRPPGQRGVYVLAGDVRGDGSLPYWWIPRTRLTGLRARFDRRRGGRILNLP